MHLRNRTDRRVDSKRKASEQLDERSSTKRIKNSHSESLTPEKEEKLVIPFPEKVGTK